MRVFCTFRLPEEHDPMSLIVPDASVRTFVRFPEFTEVDAEFRLAQVPPVVAPSFQPLLPQDSHNAELFHNVWRRTRRIHDPFYYSDPTCRTNTEGGQRGPNISCEGEMIRYLPYSGIERDAQSDTDSDGRDDHWGLPPPGDDYMKDFVSPDHGGYPVPNNNGKIADYRQEMTDFCEAELHKSHRDAAMAPYYRLHELNKHITQHENKIYLG